MLSCSLSSKQLRGSDRVKLKSVTEIGRLSERDIVFNSSATYITQPGYLSLLEIPLFLIFSPSKFYFPVGDLGKSAPGMSTFSLHSINLLCNEICLVILSESDQFIIIILDTS